MTEIKECIATHVVEWHRNLYCICYQVLDFSQSSQVVLGLNVFCIADVHPGDQTTERSDSVTLSDTKNGGIDVGSTGFQRAECICNGCEDFMSILPGLH